MAIITTFIYEFSLFLGVSITLDLIGIKDIINYFISFALVNLIKKYFPYKKGQNFELDERLNSNTEKAGHVTLFFVILALQISYFYLKLMSNPFSMYVLIFTIAILIVYSLVLVIFMRKY